MGFHGDLLPDQQFPAQQYRAAPVLGEEPVIISAAVAQPLSQSTLKDYITEHKPDIVICVRDETAFLSEAGNGITE